MKGRTNHAKQQQQVHAGVSGRNSEVHHRERKISEKIREEFIANKRLYGYRKMQKSLEKKGIVLSEYKVRQLMRKNGLYPLSIRGSKTDITIMFNPNLKAYGRVREDAPSVIELSPLAFSNEIELANTLAHELNHARSYLKGGSAPEYTAYRSGNTLADYINGRI